MRLWYPATDFAGAVYILHARGCGRTEHELGFLETELKRIQEDPSLSVDFDMQKKNESRFDKAGISAAFPKRDLYSINH